MPKRAVKLETLRLAATFALILLSWSALDHCTVGKTSSVATPEPALQAPPKHLYMLMDPERGFEQNSATAILLLGACVEMLGAELNDRSRIRVPSLGGSCTKKEPCDRIIIVKEKEGRYQVLISCTDHSQTKPALGMTWKLAAERIALAIRDHDDECHTPGKKCK